MKYAMTTAQRFYDMTVEGLRAQGGPSMGVPPKDLRAPNGDAFKTIPVCLYRSEVNGEKRKCAAGLHITDQEYNPQMECRALNPSYMEKWFNEDHVLNVHFLLAVKLQGAHDSAARESNGYELVRVREGEEFFKHLESKLKNVAINHNLFYTPPRN